MFEIRLATEQDVSAVLKISNYWAEHTAANFAVEPETLASWQADWRDTHQLYPWFVAVEGKQVIAFAKATPWKGRCAYSWSAEVTVYVHRDHHRRGLARALYDQLITTLSAQGFHTLLAGIAVPNPASEKLHEAFGFRRIGLLERVGWKFDKWHDVGLWELQLAKANAKPGPIVPVQQALAY